MLLEKFIYFNNYGKQDIFNLVIIIGIFFILFKWAYGRRESFRDTREFNDQPLCTQGTPCGLTNGTVNSHREKVEHGALPYTGPNQPGALKRMPDHKNPEPFNIGHSDY